MTALTTLYMSNNNIKNFAELEKLAALPNLRDVLFVGNPMYRFPSPQDTLRRVRMSCCVLAADAASGPTPQKSSKTGSVSFDTRSRRRYEGLSSEEARVEVLRRLPNLAKIDGSMVLQAERDAASAAAAEE